MRALGCTQSGSTETKGTVVIHNATELMAYNKARIRVDRVSLLVVTVPRVQGEEKMLEDTFSAISAVGINVVVAGVCVCVGGGALCGGVPGRGGTA